MRELRVTLETVTPVVVGRGGTAGRARTAGIVVPRRAMVLASTGR